jgi:hypothetical protein
MSNVIEEEEIPTEDADIPTEDEIEAEDEGIIIEED